MIKHNGKDYYGITEVCKLVERSTYTITMWYNAEQYAKEHGVFFPLESLPEPKRDFDNMNSRYWTREQVDQLIAFRDNIKRGDLAFYNRKYSWGQRGKVMQEKLDFKQQVERETGEHVDDLMKGIDEID